MAKKLYGLNEKDRRDTEASNRRSRAGNKSTRPTPTRRRPGGGSGGHGVALHWAPVWGVMFIQRDTDEIILAINATGRPVWKDSHVTLSTTRATPPDQATDAAGIWPKGRDVIDPVWTQEYTHTIVQSDSCNSLLAQVTGLDGGTPAITTANAADHLYIHSSVATTPYADVDGFAGSGNWVSFDWSTPGGTLPWPSDTGGIAPDPWFPWPDPIFEDPFAIFAGKVNGDALMLHLMFKFVHPLSVGADINTMYAVWVVHAPAPKGDDGDPGGGGDPWTGFPVTPDPTTGTTTLVMFKALVNNAGGYASTDATIAFDGTSAIVGTAPASGNANNAEAQAFVNNEPITVVGDPAGNYFCFKAAPNVITALVNQANGVRPSDATFPFDTGVAIIGTAATTGDVDNANGEQFLNNQPLILIQRNNNTWQILYRAPMTGWFKVTTTITAASEASGERTQGSGAAKQWILKTGSESVFVQAAGTTSIANMVSLAIPVGKTIRASFDQGRWVANVEDCGA